MKKYLNFLHVVVAILLTIILGIIGTKELTAATIRSISFLSASIGILALIMVFVNRNLGSKIVFYIIDGILIIYMFSGLFGGKGRNDIPYVASGLMLFYAVAYPLYYSTVIGRAKRNKDSIIFAIGVLTTKLLAVGTGISLFTIALRGENKDLAALLFKVSFAVVVIITVGLILQIMKMNHKRGYAKPRSNPSPSTSSSSGSNTQAQIKQASDIAYRIASRHAKSYYQGNAILNIRVSRTVTNSDIRYIVSGTVRASGPIKNQTDADLLQMNTQRCVENILDSLISQTESAQMDGAFYIKADCDDITFQG